MSTGLPKYIDPLSDPGFKILFGRESSKDILIGFLNMLLADEMQDPIVDVTHLDKEHVKETSEGRSILYDIHCETSCGKRFIVEMQNNAQTFFTERTVYYVSRSITEQGKAGKWRYDFKPVYGIFFTNFNIYNSERKLRTDVVLADSVTGKQFSDKLRMIYIQLPEFKIERPEDCKTHFERWIYLLKNMETLVTMPFTDMDRLYKRIEEVSRVESLNRHERLQYERELKAYRDYNNTLLTAKEEGLADGLSKGIAQGRVQGIAQGRAEERAKIVMQLHSNGMEDARIAEILGIPEQEIRSILGTGNPEDR